MDFRLSKGPWTTLFEGVMEGHKTEVIANPDGLLLAIVYETEGEKQAGGLIQCYRVFRAKGNLENFIDTLPRRALSLVKHSKENTYKFLLLDSGSAYAVNEEEAFIKETDALMAKIQSFSSLVREVSTAYDIDLIDLEACAEEEKIAFYSIPLLGLLISPVIKKKKEKTEIELSHGEIVLGITKQGTIVKEPFDFFEKTIVSGGEKRDRLHLFHVLIESSLLSNIPAIVVDWNNAFSGLHFPNENTQQLKRYKVELDPLGFPLSFYRVGQELKADLDHISSKAFIESFGLKNNPQGTIIGKAMAMGKSNDIFQLIDRVNELPEGDKVTPFKKREAARILMLIESIYPKLFTGKNPIQQISGGWVRGIGRANILLFEKNDLRKNLLVLQSLINGLLKQFKGSEKSESLKALLFLSGADTAIPHFKSNSVSEKIASDISKLREYGVGFILESKDKVNIAREVKDQAECFLSVIKNNDVGVNVKNRKNYRVLVRPGLSKCTEMKSPEEKPLTQVQV